MSEQELNETKNLLKVANAKISAANHTLGCLMGENNDLKATNILYQEREKELVNHANSFELKLTELEARYSALLTEVSKVKNEHGCKMTDGLVPLPVDSCE